MLFFVTQTNLKNIFQDYIEGKLSKDYILNCRNCLQDVRKDELYDWFYKYINDKSKNSFIYAIEDPFDWEKHRRNQQIKNQELLLDKESFFIEVKNVFTSIGKDKLTKEELWDYRKAFIKDEERLNNTLIISLLRDWSESYFEIEYELLDINYSNEKRWQFYVVDETYRMLNNNIDISFNLKSYVIDYLMCKIDNIDLKKSIQDSKTEGYTQSHYAKWLTLFCEHWDFPFSENNLLDLLYIDHLSLYDYDQHIYKKRPLNYVISNKSNITQRVLKNIKEGNLAKPVLGSHFYLCKILFLSEAKNYLYKEMLQNRFSALEKNRILDIYLHLGGEITDLTDIFSKLIERHYWYWNLVDKLIDESTDLICTTLIILLSSDKTTEDEKVIASLKILKKGKIEALEYFNYFIEKYRRSPYDYHFRTDMNNVIFPVKQALDSLLNH